MKLFAIQNSCFDCFDQYQRRQKPHLSKSLSNDLYMKNILFETKYHQKNKLSSFTSTLSNNPTKASTTLSLNKNKRNTNLYFNRLNNVTLPSLVNSMHKTQSNSPHIISLRYNGFNNDNKIVFGTIKHTKKLEISPHKIQESITTKCMPKDHFGEKIIDYIYTHINKNEGITSPLSLNKLKKHIGCDVKMKYIIFEKIINAVIGHVVEFRSKNNNVIAREIIESFYEEEIKKLKDNLKLNNNRSNILSLNDQLNISTILCNDNQTTKNEKDNISSIKEGTLELETSCDKITLKSSVHNDKVTMNDIKYMENKMKSNNNKLGYGFDLNNEIKSPNLYQDNNKEKQTLFYDIIYKRNKSKSNIAQINFNNSMNNSMYENSKLHNAYKITKLKDQSVKTDNVYNNKLKFENKKVNTYNGKKIYNGFIQNKPSLPLSRNNCLSSSSSSNTNRITPIKHSFQTKEKLNDLTSINRIKQSSSQENISVVQINDKKYLDIHEEIMESKLVIQNDCSEQQQIEDIETHSNKSITNKQELCNLNSTYVVGETNQNDQSTKCDISNIGKVNTIKKFSNTEEIDINKDDDGPKLINKKNDNINKMNIRLQYKKLIVKGINNKETQYNNKKTSLKRVSFIQSPKVETSNEDIMNSIDRNDKQDNKPQITKRNKPTPRKSIIINKETKVQKTTNANISKTVSVSLKNNVIDTKKNKPQQNKNFIKINPDQMKPIQLLHSKTSYHLYIYKNDFLKQITYQSTLFKHLQLNTPYHLQRYNSAKQTKKSKKYHLALIKKRLFPNDYLNYSFTIGSNDSSLNSSLISPRHKYDEYKKNLLFNNYRSPSAEGAIMMQLKKVSNKKSKFVKDYFNMKPLSKFVNYNRFRSNHISSNRFIRNIKSRVKDINTQNNSTNDKINIDQETQNEPQISRLQHFMEMVKRAKEQGTDCYIKELTDFLDGEFVKTDIYKSKLIEERINKFKEDFRLKLDQRKTFSNKIFKGLMFEDTTVFTNKNLISQ